MRRRTSPSKQHRHPNRPRPPRRCPTPPRRPRTPRRARSRRASEPASNRGGRCALPTLERETGGTPRCPGVSSHRAIGPSVHRFPDRHAGGFMSNRLMSTAALVALALGWVGWRGVASADLSKTIITAFKGELVITKGELPEGKSEKDTIARI